MAGADGITVSMFALDLEHNLELLQEDLLTEQYKPGPLFGFDIPKPTGGFRRLAIPDVRDRVVQSSTLHVLQPIFEAEFEKESFGYRPGLSYKDAIRRLEVLRNEGYTWVVDADIDSYFDQVDHDLLIKRLAELVHEEAVLDLIRHWLEADMMFNGQRVARLKGLPQGSVISPVLANLFLDELDEALLADGYRLVRYADDCAPRRRIGGRDSSVQPCCTRDEGWPLEAAMQVEASNHLLLLRLRDVVGSELGKGRTRSCQV